jgi:hypothetical protein
MCHCSTTWKAVSRDVLLVLVRLTPAGADARAMDVWDVLVGAVLTVVLNVLRTGLFWTVVLTTALMWFLFLR